MNREEILGKWISVEDRFPEPEHEVFVCVRSKIANYIKFAIFLLVTLIGFFTIYAMIWVCVGLPVNWLASLIVVVISGLSEWGYVSWLMN